MPLAPRRGLRVTALVGGALAVGLIVAWAWQADERAAAALTKARTAPLPTLAAATAALPSRSSPAAPAAAIAPDVTTAAAPADRTRPPPDPGMDSASPRRPAGITPAQWAQLQRELGPGSAELQRVADYLHWADAAQRLRQAAPGSAERALLAATVGAGLDARLARGELHAGEALQWQRAVLEATVNDAAERQRQLDAWVARQPGGAVAAAAPDPRQAELERRQAALLARHGTAVDAQALSAELEALRAQVFATPHR